MSFKKLATYIGRVFVVLSFIFLFFVIKGLDFSKLYPLFELNWVYKFIFLSIFFALIYLFNASAWGDMLEIITKKRFSKVYIPIYLKTVVLKYLPGNVFHFLGRHILSKEEDISHKEILLSNTLEIVMLLCSVLFWLMLGTIFVDFKLNLFDLITLDRISLFVISAIIALLLTLFIIYKGYQDRLLNRLTLKIFIKNSLFLFGSALSLLLVFYLFFDLDFSVESFLETIFVALIAWLLGFVIPGAPGGIGIRESIYIVLLPSFLAISKEIVVAAALIYRVVSISGEALTYLMAKILYR
jgi:uncharacterized membrane protein YbhN (UPF0104 family)